MKITIKSLLILGLLSNFSATFSMENITQNQVINKQVADSYFQFRASEQSKRKLRYSAGILGVLGIGSLLYHSMRSAEGQQLANINARDFTALRDSVHDLESRVPKNSVGPTAALSWSMAVKKYVVSTLKNSFFGMTTIGTAMVMMAVQGFGAGIFTKGVLNPAMEKFIGIYSINRFISTKTKINQNIKDLIRSLMSMNQEASEDIDQKLFETTFGLLERDIINILGFMMYICSFVNRADQLIVSKARAVFAQVKKCLIDLHRLKKDNECKIDKFKDVLSKLIDQCESFSDICVEIGTDYMEDLYASTFDQLKQSLNIDMPAPQLPNIDDFDADAFKQMFASVVGGNLAEEQDEAEALHC